jgi:zinc D-Ala-D-Ala carboxypeptidase
MPNNALYLQRIEEAFLTLRISQDYGIQRGLVPYPEASALVVVAETEPPKQLAPEAARRWYRLKQAAAADGIELLLVSGFRSFERQRQIIETKLGKGQDIESVLKVMAAPGYSQHHTGQALDIGTTGHVDLMEDFAGTDAFNWLGAHAKEFGFYMPYPRGNRFGFIYEPWHWALIELA